MAGSSIGSTWRPGSTQDSKLSSGTRRPQSRGSLSQRYQRLEENMLKNLSTMNYHRVEMANVVQQRKENARKAMEELKNSDDLQSFSRPQSRGLGIPPLAFQSMRNRVSALEDNADQNQEAMKAHRSILESVKLAKQDGAGIAVQEEVLNMKAPLVDRCQMIEENARKISARLEESAKDDGALRPASAPTGRNGSIGGSTSVPLRPGSACTGVVLRGAPEAARERAIRVNTSRPCTPNTLLARCKALETNLVRNRQTLFNNRNTLTEIHERRKQQAEASMQEMGKSALSA